MARKTKQDSYTLHNKVQLVLSGTPYFDELVRLIVSAKRELHVQVYIFEPDETGRKIKSELIAAAGREVQVFLLIDALGSSSFPEKWIAEMKEAGIYFRWFGPLFTGPRLHIGRRMHHKIAVTDATTALVGGINIGDRYNALHNEEPWFDMAVKAEGEIAFQLHAFCSKKWKGMRIASRKPAFRNFLPLPVGLTENTCRVRLRINDMLRRKARIVYSYRNAIRQAEKSILILGAYFIPGHTVIRLMKKAVKRGVTVTVITGAHSDVWLARYGKQYLYRMLIRNKIAIYEYTPAAVHGKALVADEQFVTIGSYDLNQLSTFINLELNLDIDDSAFGSHFHRLLIKTMHQDCIQVTESLLEKREKPFTLFKQWLAFRTLRVLFFLTLFTADKRAE